MSPNSKDTKKEISDGEIESFLNRWMPLPLPNGKADCPPYPVLVALSKQSEDSAQEIAPSLAASAKHLGECDHCKKIIELLRQTERPKVTLEHIFAKASREAQEVRSKPPDSARRSIPSFYRSPASFTFLRSRPRPIMALAVSIVLVAVVWVAGRYFTFFKTSDNVATVSFEKNESKELLQSLEVRLAQIQQTRIQSQQEKQYVEDYNAKIAEIKELNREKKLLAEDRGDAAFLMTQYRSELEKQIKDNRIAKHKPTTTTGSKIENEPDTQSVMALINSVDQAKKNGDPGNAVVEVAKPETIRAVAQQVQVESMNNDQVVVRDKITERPREEKDALLKSMQTFAAQERRKVYLRIGTETMAITPTSTFVRPNPKE